MMNFTDLIMIPVEDFESSVQKRYWKEYDITQRQE